MKFKVGDNVIYTGNERMHLRGVVGTIDSTTLIVATNNSTGSSTIVDGYVVNFPCGTYSIKEKDLQEWPIKSINIENSFLFEPVTATDNKTKSVKIESFSLYEPKTSTSNETIDLSDPAYANQKWILSIDTAHSVSEPDSSFTIKTSDWTISTEETERINTLNNTRIPQIKTIVKLPFSPVVGTAVCDKADYDEREGILNAIANAVFNGNFDRYYNHKVKEKEKMEKAACKCEKCGKVYSTPSEARDCEIKHLENKLKKAEKKVLKTEAKRRLEELKKENQIKAYMEELLKKEN